jgi:hypothetical protein
MAVINKRMDSHARLLKVSMRTASVVISLIIVLSAKRVFNIVKPEGKNTVMHTRQIE